MTPQNYFLLLFATFIYYAIYTVLSKYNNELQTPGIFWATYIFGALCPFWAILSKYSTNIYRDGFAYDFMMMAAYVAVLYFMGAGNDFKPINWAGIPIVIVGLIMMKL